VTRLERAEVAPNAERLDEAAPAILRVEDVVKEYTREAEVVRAVDDVSLQVAQGGFVAIVGPSGAGKSTLLHLVGGLDRPSRGRILLEGRDLAGLSQRELTLVRRRRIGFVFQFFNLLPNLPTWHNIAIPLLIDGIAPDKARRSAEELARRLGIHQRVETPARLLSGGEMQRTAIARALAADPALILADEPTGNLDRATGAEVLEFLRDLVDHEGRTVVLVTHDEAAAHLADAVVHMVDGRIVKE
jgi:putative ABC transport system ATP-binding protein